MSLQKPVAAQAMQASKSVNPDWCSVFQPHAVTAVVKVESQTAAELELPSVTNLRQEWSGWKCQTWITLWQFPAIVG
jgi:hypothetical protein